MLALLPTQTSSLDRVMSRQESSTSEAETKPVVEHPSSPFPGMSALMEHIRFGSKRLRGLCP